MSVSELCAKSFWQKEKFKDNHTEIIIDSNGSVMLLLHGNLIAKLKDENLLFATAGWPTKTTLSRLNAILSGNNRYNHNIATRSIHEIRINNNVVPAHSWLLIHPLIRNLNYETSYK